MQIDAADRSTPDAVRKELGRFGGLNPYHRANWRLVLAQDRLVRRGGIFTTMPSGDVAVMEIDPKTFEVHRREVKPEKVVTGYHDVPKYPVKGWVLERWFPASKYGTQSDWEAAKSSDGVTPMMGPYPHEGDYFMLAGPFDRIPDIGDLKMAIQMHIREEEERPVGYNQMLLNEINADLEAEQKAYDKTLKDLAHFYDSEVEPILRGSSLGAGRIRNELAAELGDRTHQGVI
jgi:hypothetical protein